MNNRYDAMFAAAADRGEGVFGGFVMLGDPDLETSAAMLDALVAGGADMIEVGIPFSDPVADGPVIQAAAVRALEAGVRTDDCLQLLREFRARHAHVPVGVLTYANIVAAKGRAAFCEALAVAGVDSLLIADVPTLEAAPYVEACKAAGIAPVMIAAPNSSDEQLDRIAAMGAGYTYCVARAGVTGQRQEMALDHGELFAKLEQRGAAPPVLGFGISTPQQVRQGLDAGAAGVISGSAIVAAAAGADDPASAVRALVSDLKAGTR